MAQPEDACPYRRPFPDGFDDCPAYQPFLAGAADSGLRSLAAIWTCRNMEPASRRGGGGFYARCRLGTEADRRRWAGDAGHAALAALRRTLAVHMQPWYTALYQAKANDRGMEATVQEAKEEFRRWASASAAMVEAAGIAPEEFLAYHAEALDDLARSPAGGVDWKVPERLVRKYGERLQALARPDLAP